MAWYMLFDLTVPISVSTVQKATPNPTLQRLPMDIHCGFDGALL